jgi:Flp pilus assembly protein TadD
VDAVVAEGRREPAAWLLAATFVLAAAATLRLTPLAWRPPASRSDLEARVGVLPGGVAERRLLARLELADGRPGAATAQLRAAGREHPFGAGVWLDRGEAALRAGRPSAARRAARAALARAPVDAAVCRRAALLLLQVGEAEEAAAALRCVVTRTPWNAFAIYDLAHAVYADDERVVQAVVPPTAEALRRFLGWAYDRGEAGAATAGWTALSAHRPEATDVVRHVDVLVAYGDLSAAETVWTAGFGPRDPGLVVDGGFERGLVSGGFGWRLSPVDGARIGVAGGEAAAEGERGLALEFTGKNLDFSHVTQLVPVAGMHRYRLTARVRSAGLTSLSGPRLRVDGPASCTGLTAVEGPELRGTQPWTEVALEFVTPPDCGAVRVVVRRPPTARLDRELRGRLWLDDVRLADLGRAS